MASSPTPRSARTRAARSASYLADEQQLYCECHQSKFDPRDEARVDGRPGAPQPAGAAAARSSTGRLVVAGPFTARPGFEQQGEAVAAEGRIHARRPGTARRGRRWSTATASSRRFGLVRRSAAQRPRRRRRAAAAAAADAGDPQGLPAGHRGAAAEARRRRLADDPPHLRRLGLQPARSDHAGQRRAAAAGVDLLDRRHQRTRSAADRERRRDVRVDAGQPGDRRRGEDRHAAVALSPADARGRRGACIRPRAASRSTATRCTSRPTKACWSRSMRGPARKCGPPTSATTSSGYYMTLAPLVAEGRVMIGARAASSAFAASSPPTTPRPASRRGRPTRCRRRASRAARPGRRAISGRPAARRCG